MTMCTAMPLPASVVYKDEPVFAAVEVELKFWYVKGYEIPTPAPKSVSVSASVSVYVLVSVSVFVYLSADFSWGSYF